MIKQTQRGSCLLVLAAFLSATGCGNETLSTEPSETPYYGDTELYTDTEQDEDTAGYDADSEQMNPGVVSCFAQGFESPGAEAGDGADAGESCEVTAECLEPLLCIKGRCTAPGPWESYCDGVDVLCPKKFQTCVNFQCVNLDDRCRSNVECPAGYACTCPPKGLCLKRQCRPADEECAADGDCAEGQICDFGTCLAKEQCKATADLRGTFSATSTLRLGAAGDSAVGGLISATQWLRDLLEGGGLFPELSDVISNVVRTYLLYNLQDYQVELIFSLVDLTDILNEAQIEHRMTLDAPCGEMYRGEMTLDRIILQYKGEVFARTPDEIPAIGLIPPAQFGATLQCETLAIDEVRVDYLASGLNRYATDVLVQVITQNRHKHLEGALRSLIDCSAVSSYVVLALGMPALAGVVEPACNLALEATTKGVTKALGDSQNPIGWIDLQGEAAVDYGQLENGRWFGSTLTDDLTGDFSTTKL